MLFEIVYKKKIWYLRIFDKPLFSFNYYYSNSTMKVCIIDETIFNLITNLIHELFDTIEGLNIEIEKNFKNCD